MSVTIHIRATVEGQDSNYGKYGRHLVNGIPFFGSDLISPAQKLMKRTVTYRRIMPRYCIV